MFSPLLELRRIAALSPRVITAGVTLALALVVTDTRSFAQGPLEATPSGKIDGHPALEKAPRHATTTEGHQGDAVNVAFIGSEEDLHRTLAAAGWYTADPITLETSLRIAADCVLQKPYAHAPVSDLYVWGRKQDAAFEQPLGKSPNQRHHVRFWQSQDRDSRGRPLWLGAATFDQRVEISRKTGGFTHKISPAIDQERDKLLVDSITASALDGYYWVDDFHREPNGTNGGGDPYYTDRRLAVGVIDLRR